MSYFFFSLLFLFFVFIGLNIFVQKNPIVSIFFFILIILDISGLLLYLNMEFLGYVLVIIYIGAIAILFLFMVMMLNVKTYELYVDFSRLLLAAFIIFYVLFLIMVFPAMEIWNIKHWRLLGYVNGFNYVSPYAQLYYVNVLKVLGFLLFSSYGFVIVLLSLILLIGIVGSITLTLSSAGYYKRQEMHVQIERNFLKLLVFKK